MLFSTVLPLIPNNRYFKYERSACKARRTFVSAHNEQGQTLQQEGRRVAARLRARSALKDRGGSQRSADFEQRRWLWRVEA